MVKGKAIICKYDSTFDDQKAHAKMPEHHLKSTKVSLIPVKILGNITSDKIADGSCFKLHS
jgi:hypothetical protein